MSNVWNLMAFQKERAEKHLKVDIVQDVFSGLQPTKQEVSREGEL